MCGIFMRDCKSDSAGVHKNTGHCVACILRPALGLFFDAFGFDGNSFWLGQRLERNHHLQDSVVEVGVDFVGIRSLWQLDATVEAAA